LQLLSRGVRQPPAGREGHDCSPETLAAACGQSSYTDGTTTVTMRGNWWGGLDANGDGTMKVPSSSVWQSGVVPH
jgi:hypothetical protein